MTRHSLPAVVARSGSRTGTLLKAPASRWLRHRLSERPGHESCRSGANLARRPVRTCLSILGIGLAVGSALALMSLSHSIQDGMREGINEMGDDLVVMQKGASDIFGGFIPEQTIERIASTPGVTRASGELFMFAPSADGSSVLAQGWPDTSYLWKKVPLREGRVPAGGEHGVAVLGDAAAAALGKKLGDDIVILGDK